MIKYWETLVNDYPIISIEDPLDENDYEGYGQLTDLLGKEYKLLGMIFLQQILRDFKQV